MCNLLTQNDSGSFKNTNLGIHEFVLSLNLIELRLTLLDSDVILRLRVYMSIMSRGIIKTIFIQRGIYSLTPIAKWAIFYPSIVQLIKQKNNKKKKEKIGWFY